MKMDSEEYLSLIGESYLYGYPLVMMDITKKVITNVSEPHPEKASAPINQMGHYRAFPDHTMTAVVKPNVDTYYSISWLEIRDEPYVLSIPATDRYYLFPMMDAYSNVFASPGTRTTGKEEQKWLIAGRDWDEEVPDGMALFRAPTETIWILGRIQINSFEDGSTFVRTLQDQISLVPLSEMENPDYMPPKGSINEDYVGLSPVKAIQSLDVASFFNRLSQLMVDNPPPLADSVMVSKMKRIGFEPGKPFNVGSGNFIFDKKIDLLPAYIHEQMDKRRENPDKEFLSNGWAVIRDGIGNYGKDYARRAFIAYIALGACNPEDAVYPNLAYDRDGDRLNASNNYIIHFEPEGLPPVQAFWSLTAYNENEFLIKNDLNRYALGDRDSLTLNDDGSLDLYIQSEAPSDVHKSNWLPIPEDGQFFLTMRLYWPEESVLDGSWIPPYVEKNNDRLAD